MAEMKHSAALEKLLEYARNKVGDDHSSLLTAEKFLVAVIEAVTTDDILPSDQSAVLAEMLSKTDAKIDNAKKHLLEYINDRKKASYMDSIYMQRKMLAAQTVANTENSSEVTPEMLLSCILADPSLIIRKTFSLRGQPEPVVTKSTETNAPVTDTAKKQEEKPDTPCIPDTKQKIKELVEKTKGIQTALSEIVYGQDNAVNIFASGYFQAELLSLTDKKRVRPAATYLFAGPPGVGKTFLAESAAKVLGLPFQRFDMSEYSEHESALEFIGSDGVYKNSKSGNFTDFVSKNPKSLILFDEVEKAHISIIHLFLQILDAGRIRDSKTDEELSLKDVIMIFTTNAGRQLYSDAETGDFSSVSRKVILKAIQKDINPLTKEPYFPEAICSRFASGNVVMFNHMTATSLRNIAKREVLRHAGNYEREVGVRIDIDDNVFTSILFAEGGHADARTVRSRAESFFDSELFELFRLTESETTSTHIDDIEKIKISVELPEEGDILSLFKRPEKAQILVFSSQKVYELCESKNCGCTFVHTDNATDAKKLMGDRDISAVMIDMNFGSKNGAEKYLNLEDIDSESREFFRFIRESYADTPVFLLQTDDRTIGNEEKVSFARQGVRGIVAISEGNDIFADEIEKICTSIHHQNSMSELAKANKIVTFETAQTISDDGKNAEIKLFDLKTAVALDAEDSKDILSNVSKPSVGFDRVIGADEAKKELKFFVEYLKNPKKYLGTGLAAPKGVLLYGPPGTGKTMLAKAMASESGVTFIAAEGNQFIKKYIGEGTEAVHELFRTARKYAPAILFIDEIDAIAKERRGGSDGTREVEATLTAFLTEMDGFKNNTSKPVFVLAATNFEVEPGHKKSLDPALMRRFDRRVYIDLPKRDDRIKYMKLKMSLNKAYCMSEQEIENIAMRSTGMSLAELESVFELALRTAIRDGKLTVTDQVFEEAFETFNSGEKKNWDISQLERVARHEAGHAYMCWLGGETPSYITIVARGDHGGYMQHAENEGKAIYTKEEMLARIRTSLGGRAAEMVYYGEKDGVSTGASGDLQSATNLARRLICTYGMDEDFGLAVVDASEAISLSLGSEVRTAINKILSDEMHNTREQISLGKAKIDRLVSELMQKNHLNGNEIKAIFAE